MQIAGQAKPPVGVVFDAFMGHSIDDALALALLNGLAGKDEARIASISVSNPSLKAAAYCDVIERFYASATTGPAAMFFKGLPIGMAAGAGAAETPMLTAVLSQRDADGKPVYPTGIRELNETADPATLIRNSLTAQYDQNAVIVATGPLTNLAKLLDLRDTKDLIARKVKYLVFSGGAFAQGQAAARKLFAEWPSSIISVWSEIGEALPFPASSIEKDFNWTPHHPVVDAYRAYHAMPYDAPSAAMAAVLYAVRPNENYFKVSDPIGKHRHLTLDPEQKDRIIAAYIELASAKPVARKFRPPKQDQKKEDPKPPAPPTAAK